MPTPTFKDASKTLPKITKLLRRFIKPEDRVSERYSYAQKFGKAAKGHKSVNFTGYPHVKTQYGQHVIIAVGTVFFLSELGDKTMLATITLATRHGIWGTWLGSTVGMVAADALAIIIGRALGARLPEKAIRISAAVLFFVFGALLLIDALN